MLLTPSQNMIVETVDTLELPSFLRLIKGDIAILQVRRFYDPDLCREIADRMLASPLFGMYKNAPDIGRTAMSFFETLVGPEELATYFANAHRWIDQLRHTCDPHPSPIDRLLSGLQHMWPDGCNIASLGGQQMFVGLTRVFRNGAIAEPHQDNLEWYTQTFPEPSELLGQLGCNIYLSLPEQGGDLMVWPVSFTYDEYEERKIPTSYGIQDQFLQDFAPLVLTPQLGDVILFSARNVHAVTSSYGNRVTASCFVGHRGLNRSLVVWS